MLITRVCYVGVRMLVGVIMENEHSKTSLSIGFGKTHYNKGDGELMNYTYLIIWQWQQTLSLSQICFLIDGSRLSYLFRYVYLVVVGNLSVLKQLYETSFEAHHLPILQKYSRGCVLNVIISCLQLFGNVLRLIRDDTDSIHSVFVSNAFNRVLLLTGCSQPTP